MHVMNNQTLYDQRERECAINPRQSYIVQAPAGSGKTELLTQRFLVLLAQAVKEPEEIIALTFTRKAAAEMRTRVMTALALAQSPDTAKQLKPHTYAIAQQVLARDQERKWQLLNNPNRLRIQTIDSLCARIVEQLATHTDFATTTSISEQSERMYREAVQELILQDNSDALNLVLDYLEHDLNKAQTLLITLLKKREQWLPYLFYDDEARARKTLERSLAHIITENIAAAKALLPAELTRQWLQLATYAFANLGLTLDESISNTMPNDLHTWMQLVELVLTKDGHWRAQVTKNQGFPAPSEARHPEDKQRLQEMKQQMLAFLIACQDYPEVEQQLHALRQLPAPNYSEIQWHVLRALLEVLHQCAARLQLKFISEDCCDFTEIQMKALMALGDSDQPSDVALQLDEEIRHLLVDEFQDTSQGQFRLLEKLTAGWQSDDGRTLFIVGDPMQSIYSFRAANVGLFLRAQQFGIGSIQLESLTLSTNFRSSANLVQWYNQTFVDIFPKHEDISTGAISFHRARAHQHSNDNDNDDANSNDNEHSIALAPFISENVIDAQQALYQQLAHTIATLRAEHPDHSMAILVRAASHARPLFAFLSQQHIHYQAIELENLSERPLTRDLIILLRALIHPADRIAVLAALRAPWCGLTLADLHAIVPTDPKLCLLDAICDPNRLCLLSIDGQQRIIRLAHCLSAAPEELALHSMRQVLEQTWVACGGAAAVANAAELTESQLFFQTFDEFLDANHAAGTLFDIDELTDFFAHHKYSAPCHADNPLQIMTIHKAKGLEFDHVFLLGLERDVITDPHQLLVWQERLHPNGQPDLLLAPIKPISAIEEPIYSYIRQQTQCMQRYEVMRLLYVAVTRARSQLHFYFTVKSNNGHIQPPSSASLLKHLWPSIKHRVNQQHVVTQEQFATTVIAPQPARLLKRLHSDWFALNPDRSCRKILTTSTVQLNSDANLYTLAQDTEQARMFGILLHATLQRLALLPCNSHTDMLQREIHLWQCQLRMLGWSSEICAELVRRLEATFMQVLNDTQAQWILAQTHQDAHAELSLSQNQDTGIKQSIIDRTFIDSSNTRWIIDYKTTEEIITNKEEFLVIARDRHAAQLAHYATLMQRYDAAQFGAALPIKCGLYYPITGWWCEWTMVFTL